MDTLDLTDVPFHLAPGDLLLLYSDGATEVRLRPRGGAGDLRGGRPRRRPGGQPRHGRRRHHCPPHRHP
ncbi:SpoIIE family protein phosphatase [Streptomyces sp. NPDC086147]|uniref:SpoIIE family protein phosphatase n=1 Tax=Streptomyces sp. NPDC086147 TaxID=3155295 RepID=UPI00344E8F23